MTAKRQQDLLGPLLRDVSRSFYLTLRVLPAELRPQISLAYLLARATDTIADTQAVPRAQRLTLLHQLRAAVAARNGPGCPAIQPVAARQTLAAEKSLLERLPECFAVLAGFGPVDQTHIAQLLATITDGQIFDLERFPGESEKELVALATADELDRYTYLVAGCVGEFWTRMCAAHIPALAGWQDGKMEAAGVRFGQGLQLVNVLRDLPKDLRIGRCYLPVTEPQRLLDPGNFSLIATTYQQWLDRAVAHLDAGWEYTQQIPAGEWRLRLACTWPIWIGLKTIARLRRDNPLDPGRRIKISRADVYGLMLRSSVRCRSTVALDKCHQELRRQAAAA